MNAGAKTLRRTFGAICLLAAIGMLVLGETALAGKLAPVAFLLYWLGCLAFTVLAIVTALADVRALRRETHDEQRQLIDRTLQNVPTKPPPSKSQPDD